MDELSYNTPLFGKNKGVTECENCKGDGTIEHYDVNDNGIPIMEKSICMCCNGEGQIEIEN